MSHTAKPSLIANMSYSPRIGNFSGLGAAEEMETFQQIDQWEPGKSVMPSLPRVERIGSVLQKLSGTKLEPDLRNSANDLKHGKQKEGLQTKDPTEVGGKGPIYSELPSDLLNDILNLREDFPDQGPEDFLQSKEMKQAEANSKTFYKDDANFKAFSEIFSYDGVKFLDDPNNCTDKTMSVHDPPVVHQIKKRIGGKLPLEINNHDVSAPKMSSVAAKRASFVVPTSLTESSASLAKGIASVAKGSASLAKGNASGKGIASVAKGSASLAKGNASGKGIASIAKGSTSLAKGNASGKGIASVAKGSASLAKGNASGKGILSIAKGSASFAKGKASGTGILSIAKGNKSFGKGIVSIAKSRDSFAKGIASIAKGNTDVGKGKASSGKVIPTIAKVNKSFGKGKASSGKDIATISNGNTSFDKDIASIAQSSASFGEILSKHFASKGKYFCPLSVQGARSSTGISNNVSFSELQQALKECGLMNRRVEYFSTHNSSDAHGPLGLSKVAGTAGITKPLKLPEPDNIGKPAEQAPESETTFVFPQTMLVGSSSPANDIMHPNSQPQENVANHFLQIGSPVQTVAMPSQTSGSSSLSANQNSYFPSTSNVSAPPDPPDFTRYTISNELKHALHVKLLPFNRLPSEQHSQRFHPYHRNETTEQEEYQKSLPKLPEFM